MTKCGEKVISPAPRDEEAAIFTGAQKGFDLRLERINLRRDRAHGLRVERVL